MSTESLENHLQELLNHSQGRSQGHHVVHGAAGGSGLLWAARQAKEEERPLLLLAPSYDEALEAIEDLSFYLPRSEIGFFPHPDVLPYDNQSPAKAVTAGRLHCLLRIKQGHIKIAVTTPQAMLQRLMPPDPLERLSFSIRQGQEIEPDDLARRLVELGYTPVEMVEERGEFSRRGGIFDLFPVEADEPVRIDFFDIEIESIKTFAVESQGSKDEVQSVSFLPASEVLINEETKARALAKFNDIREGTEKNRFYQIREELEHGVLFSGIESFLPLFYEETASLLDYFPSRPLVIFLDQTQVEQQAKESFEQILQEYQYALEQGEPSLDPLEVFFEVNRFLAQISQGFTVDLDPMQGTGPDKLDLKASGVGQLAALNMDQQAMHKSPAQRVLELLIQWHQLGTKIGILAGSQSKADHLRQLIEGMGLTPEVIEGSAPNERLAWLVTPPEPTRSSFVIFTNHLHQGFRFQDQAGKCLLAMVNEEEIFGPKGKKRRVKESNLKHFMSSLGDLNPGDYVVHVEYGVGTYEGLKKIAAGANEADFLVLGYHGGDKVYVPVEKFHLVQKFKGGEGHRAQLAKLGDKAWSKTKARVQREVDDIAEELVALYAKRAAQRGIQFSPNGEMAQEFDLAFPYNETEDQHRAIEEVREDMESIQPMDRLVCGDVGFGKTEVAMRAAFKAVSDGYQVGILAPTTILAQQHHDTLLERFKGQAVRIGLVSRFVTPKQTKATLEELKDGKLDILVGTHRLLSKDINFSKLGLLVVDEEQRFGVKHKERIKQIRTDVDCLTLSATPIPRTLHMSLVGIRDISVINTAPMDRRAIRTRLMKLNDFIITEAVSRELRRGGQVFFIHNRVESILEVASYLKSILPKVKIAVAHGQMHEHELEKIMFAFIHKEYDLLLATTIVESGLDIPNANTIIINNADQLGLSQLYQLRGRVGRSKAQAYCYLLTPKEKLLSETAKKRLNILSELNHLGAGFKLASYDMELRGAGDLLGAKQSGHINQLGFELYTQMIDEAVKKLTQTTEEKTLPRVELKLHLEAPASLPEPFIPSMNQRLDAYKSIAAVVGEEELWEIRHNLEDRFGILPEEALNLFYSMQIRIVAQKMALEQINQEGGTFSLYFNDAFQPDPARLMGWMAGQKSAKLLPQGGIQTRLDEATPKGLADLIRDLETQVLL